LYFLAASVTSLLTFLFARQVVGSESGTAKMQRIAGTLKEGVERFFKRQYRTVAVLLGLLLPTFAFAQPEHGGGGGEANLVLPDLSSVNFLGMNGHSCLAW
jgi:K(+)-stimulated pyrophosphate-energized sodium pump